MTARTRKAAGPPKRDRSGIERLAQVVDVVRDVRTDACIDWPGVRNRDGYGRAPGGRNAHRAVYEAIFGPVDHALVIDHLCRNRSCVNPAYLEPVTRKVNAERGEYRSRTHCPAGHQYSGWNLITYDGRRYCRACTYARTRARRAALR